MTEKPDLIALVGSRICHDLISPIGAIGNGLELLMLGGGAKGAEIALISESVSQANARIRYFRVAFGTASREQRIARTEVVSILSDLWRGTRLELHWMSANDQPRREVKLIFLLLQCLESALPFGGRITVERGELRWQILATANRLRINPLHWESLSDPTVQADIDASTVHFPLAADEFHHQHRRLTVDIRESEIRLSF